MADVMSREKRSQLMARIRGKNTTPERYIAVLLDAAGIEFFQHDSSLPGRPDFALRERRVAVFVDGDFWHGWRFPVWAHRLAPKWREKIGGNRRRDLRNHRKLRRLGWAVVRLWEHQVEQDPVSCVRRVAEALGMQAVDWQKVTATYAKLSPLKRRKRLPKP